MTGFINEDDSNKINDRLFIIPIIILVCILSGCTTPEREEGIRIIEGKVIKIEPDVIFGGTFTDYRDDIYFDNGIMVSSQNRDLSSIELNRTGKYYFDKNYFKYEGCWYKFDNFKYVEYYENEYQYVLHE